jgi:uncharacterized repeat protein (TIGR04076 family)
MKNSEIKNRLVLKAEDIEGDCPVYDLGDKTIISGAQIDLEESDAVCIHALFCLGPFITALREGVSPKKLGLSTEDEGEAYFQCLDPGKPHTDGGTVLFSVKRE